MTDKFPSAPFIQHTLLFFIAAIIILIDQLTKYVIEVTLPLNRSWVPFPELGDFFRITHVANTGMAFGLFPSGSMLLATVAIIVAFVIIFYNFTLPAGHFLLRLALGLQLGGALGNLIDRFRIGHVTDFLDFGAWPVFNVADMSIVSGVIILGILMWREQNQAQEANATSIASAKNENNEHDESQVLLPSPRFEEVGTLPDEG